MCARVCVRVCAALHTHLTRFITLLANAVTTCCCCCCRSANLRPTTINMIYSTAENIIITTTVRKKHVYMCRYMCKSETALLYGATTAPRKQKRKQQQQRKQEHQLTKLIPNMSIVIIRNWC